MTVRLAALCVSVLCISGCADPTVRYSFIDAGSGSYQRSSLQPDLEGRPKFKLSSSRIRLKAEKIDGGNYVLKISSTPVEEANNVVFSIIDTSPIGIKANLKLKLKDNSMLIDSLATQLEDNRTKLIQGIGGVLGSVIGTAKAGDVSGVPAHFSAYVDLSGYFKDIAANPAEIALSDADLAKYKSAFNPPYSVTSLHIGAVPADATPRHSFPFATSQRSLVFSACRTATIKVSVSGATFEGAVKVADPNYIQTAGIPSKGSITMHSECGVSVASEPVQTSSPTDLLQELIKQIKTVFD